MNALTLISILFAIVLVGVLIYISFFAGTFLVVNKLKKKRKNKEKLKAVEEPDSIISEEEPNED